MMKATTSILATCAAALALMTNPARVRAQDGWSLSLNPRFGHFKTDKSLGPMSPDGLNLEMTPGATAGLALEVSTPVHWFSLRATGETTVNGTLSRRVQDGSTSCGSNCYHMNSKLQPFDHSSSILNLSIDAVFKPAPSSWRVAPYFVTGFGLKRYDLQSGGYTEDDGTFHPYGGRNAAATLNAGLGANLRLGRTTFNVEAVDYMNFATSHLVNIPDRTLTQHALNDYHHDLFLSVGVKVPVLGH